MAKGQLISNQVLVSSTKKINLMTMIPQVDIKLSDLCHNDNFIVSIVLKTEVLKTNKFWFCLYKKSPGTIEFNGIRLLKTLLNKLKLCAESKAGGVSNFGVTT